MQRNKHASVGSRLLFALVLMTCAGPFAMADGYTRSIVCKKRNQQVYTAFYRTELLQNDSGEWRFEYGIGDSTQIYELYFFGPVTKSGDSQFLSADNVFPKVSIELMSKRNKKMLEFTVTGSDGKSSKRRGYVCE